MATLHEVAKLAKVSPMTASRTINTPDQVRPKLRARVEEAMKALNYRKNQAASALVNRKTGIVKVVLPKMVVHHDPYYMTMFAGITSELSKKLLAMLAIDSSVEHINYDGAILMGLHTDELNSLADIPGPISVFCTGATTVDCVDVDNRNGVKEITEYLISLGHKRLCYLSLDYDEPFVREREQGFLDALKKARIPKKNCKIFQGIENSIPGGCAAGQLIFPDTEYTAFICGSDLIAIGLMQAAHEKNIKIPNDISVTGFDGVGPDTMCNPPLTTAKQPVFEIGSLLARMVIERIDYTGEKQIKPRQVMLPVEIIKRGSTAPPKT